MALTVHLPLEILDQWMPSPDTHMQVHTWTYMHHTDMYTYVCTTEKEGKCGPTMSSKPASYNLVKI